MSKLEYWIGAIVTTVLSIIVIPTNYRPPWWFLMKGDKINKKKLTIRDIPGPISLPLFGTKWIFSWFGKYRMDKIHDAYKDLNIRYGSLCKEEAFGNIPVISVFSRCDIEKLLKCNSRQPTRPPSEIVVQYRNSRKDRYTHTGLVNVQGDEWQQLRDALTPGLINVKTVMGFFPSLNHVADEFISLIKRKRNDGCVMAFERLAYRMGLESTCTLILGRYLGFLKPSTSSFTYKLAEAVRIHFTASRDAFYGLPIWKYLPTTVWKKFIKSEEEIYDLVSELLEETIDQQKEDAKDEPIEAVFQSILREKTLDMNDKKAGIVDFIAAGIHTLGNTLVFLFHLIGTDKEIQKKLYDEVINLAPEGCDLVAENLRGAKYLRACITEGFRMVPTAPCIARLLDAPIELSGYQLEEGTVVLLHTWIAGLNDDNFYNANEWMPDRWIKPLLPHSPLLVAPFGAGRRICPGKRFVEQALQLIVAKIIREFEIVAVKELELQFEFIIAPKGPVPIIFKDRSEKFHDDKYT
ncbi:hypothetical protein HCN44_005613 [Aphidius gifuensis]|uniref:Cytochrome P450 n=1 Tax=Aphidius gifuensis TaxID=684658 RepID=A0A834Y6E8_APHGI|nr:ecdysone 20-monooxygenase [Aphidius gifuensis]KAF7997336.1 hypothetical protein HCN44_005613 [Aphidius gifuensis]